MEFISAGITFIGMEDARNAEKQLMDRAVEQGIDVLALFRVTIKKNPRKEFITNDNVLSLYDPVKGNRLVWTRSLQNIKIQRAREEDEDDGMEAEIDKIVDYVDANLSMSPLPAAINQENVKRRVASLVASRSDNVLPVLTEISFWNRQGFLPDQMKIKAFQAVLGERAGNKLATGDEDAKKEAIESWLSDSGGKFR